MKQGKLLITFLLLFAGILNSYAQPRFSYEIFDGRVFFDNREIVYADYYTFVDLGYGYAKDRNHVFMNGRILPYVDPYSFNVSPRYAPEEEYPDFEADYGQDKSFRTHLQVRFTISDKPMRRMLSMYFSAAER